MSTVGKEYTKNERAFKLEMLKVDGYMNMFLDICSLISALRERLQDLCKSDEFFSKLNMIP